VTETALHLQLAKTAVKPRQLYHRSELIWYTSGSNVCALLLEAHNTSVVSSIGITVSAHSNACANVRPSEASQM
jgi:hypothetical protein